MRPHHQRLNRRQVHRSATTYLQGHVPLRDSKRKVTAPTLWAVLLTAAAGVTSIHAAGQRLDGPPAEETIRKALYASRPEFAELQRQPNRARAGRLPKAWRRRPQRLAIDLTLIPYHGEPFRDPEEVDRGRAKDRTSHFHAYATADVIPEGQRYTVELTAVAQGEPLKGGGPTSPATGPLGRGPTPPPAAGPGRLQRGRDPLPPGGAVPVPDAGGGPRRL